MSSSQSQSIYVRPSNPTRSVLQPFPRVAAVGKLFFDVEMKKLFISDGEKWVPVCTGDGVDCSASQFESRSISATVQANLIHALKTLTLPTTPSIVSAPLALPGSVLYEPSSSRLFCSTRTAWVEVLTSASPGLYVGGQNITITGNTISVSGIIPPSNGGTGLTGPFLAGQLLIGDGTNLVKNTLTAGANVTITNGPGGSITIAASGGGGGGGVSTFAAGTTGLTPAAATSGAVTLGGTLVAANGGTGNTTPYANGQLLIGNGTTLTKSTLTAGSGIAIANGAGSITVSAAPVMVGFRMGLGNSAPTPNITTGNRIAPWADIFNWGPGTVNGTLGTYTIGVAGYYFISYSAFSGNDGDSVALSMNWVNSGSTGVLLASSQGVGGQPTGGTDFATFASNTAIYQFGINDTITLINTKPSSSVSYDEMDLNGSGPSTLFQGYLIVAT